MMKANTDKFCFYKVSSCHSNKGWTHSTLNYKPGGCCGWGQGGRGGSGLGKETEGGGGNPLCAGASTGGNGVCMPGPPGDWQWAEPRERVTERWREFHFVHYWRMCVLLSSCLKETRG